MADNHVPRFPDDVTSDIEAKHAAERFDFVRFTFADINGLARSKSVARRNFSDSFKNGLTTNCGMLVIGSNGEIVLPDEVWQNKLGNMHIKPVPGTLHSVPWAAAEGNHRVGEVFCEPSWIQPFRGGAQMDACPRYIARKQLNQLEQLGYRLYSGFEAEFIVCDSSGKPIFDANDMTLTKRLAEYESFLYSMDTKLAAAGIDVATFEMEYGQGQFELVMSPKVGIQAADQMFLFKEAVKEYCQHEKGWKATFMSKPFADSFGNGHHYSHSLLSIAENGDTGNNVLFDGDSQDHLSDVAHHWLAGLIRHGRALTALCSPTVNCYRRLHKILTPDTADWGTDDRLAMIRAKVGNSRSTYFENRIPGGSCNPYLVLAATVAAGIDGIVNKLECPPPKSTTSDAIKLPESLSEAIEALESDDVMREALGDEFVRWFVLLKRQSEIEKIIKTVEESRRSEIDVERELYFVL